METTAKELDLMVLIANRADVIATENNIDLDIASTIMDLDSAHQAQPLDLCGLLFADRQDLVHDVFGIRNHMDRSEFPGKLTGCFVPRYAMSNHSTPEG